MLIKEISRILCAGLITLLPVGMIGCGGNSAKTADNGSNVPTELNIYMFGEFKNTDKVIKKFEEETKDTLNIKLNLHVNTSSDHKEKIPLLLSTGEDIDMVFDSYWMNLANLSSQGVYADLSSYFNNPDYPGLQKAFSKDFISAHSTNEKIYGIPFIQAKEDIRGLIIDKTLREKYNLPKITNDKELENYLNVIKKNEPGFDTPTTIGLQFQNNRFEERKAGIYKLDGVVGLEFEIGLDKDGKKVDSVTMLGDDASAFANRQVPFNLDTNYDRFVNKIPHWTQYVSKDNFSTASSTVKLAAYEQTLNGFTAKAADMNKKTGHEAEFYPYDKDVREMKEGAIVENIQMANNFICIPKSSEKKDAAMKFMDWIFSSQENHDLFELGIEGDDWEAVGDDEYRTLTSETQYTFAPYELTWNSNFVRVNANLPEDVKKLTKYALKDSTYLPNPLSGFRLDTSAIKLEYVAITAIMNKYKPLFMGGLLDDDTANKIKEYHDELTAVGLEKVRAEIKIQVQTFLDNKK